MLKKMMQKIRHPLVANSFSLYIAHFSDYLLALVILPLIARALGPAELGKVGLAQTFGILILLMMEFGFPLTATRNIAKNKADSEKIFSLIGDVFTFKLFLIPVVAILSLITVLVVPVFHQIPTYILIVALGSIAQGLIPTWYFQGIEKLGIIAVTKIIFRAMGFLIIVLLVDSPRDGWIVLAAYALSSLGLFLYLFTYMKNLTGPLKLSGLKTVKSTWRNSRHSFLITVLPMIINNISVFILSAAVNPIQLGLYYGAARIHRAFNTLYGPLGQAFFPHMSAAVDTDKKKAKKQAKLFLALMVFIGVLFGISLILFCFPIIKILLGPEYLGAGKTLKIFAVLLPLTAMTHVLGRQWMVANEADSKYAKILLYSGLLGFVSFLAMVKTLGIISLPVSLIVFEISVLGLIGFSYLKIRS